LSDSTSLIDPEKEKLQKEEFQRAFMEAAKKLKREEELAEKPFWDHFDELRGRFTTCLWAILVGTSIAYYFREPLLIFLKQPLFDVLPEDARHLVFTGVFESFTTSLKVSAIMGFFLSLPFIFHQAWGFISPGLHERERKLALPFVFAGTFFFVLGAAFAYYFVFPHGFKFMIEFGAPQQDIPMISVSEYFGLIFRLFLLFGIAFEFPVALMFLAKVGLVNVKMLRENRRTALIAIAFVSAICAPPDALSMIFMMIPLYFFYEGVIFLIGLKKK
jgi:sec-independent protein translocase protein TatC